MGKQLNIRGIQNIDESVALIKKIFIQLEIKRGLQAGLAVWHELTPFCRASYCVNAEISVGEDMNFR